MSEFRSYSSADRFDPHREGLLGGEEVVWTRRAGFSFWAICCGAGIIITGPILFFTFEEDFGYGFVLSQAVLVSFIAIIALLVIYVIRTRQTRYYLTTERILETRAGKILKEIPLSHFSGRPIGQFIESHVAYTKNNQPVYTISIYDPTSDMVIHIKGQDWSSLRSFEQVGNIRECPYCTYANPGIASTCKNCGAVL
ncbi:MAG: hypothetical protein BAJATHORv1_10537 [Candidatus Thorarchaeota archaeon]|nr:MAG: hypothetical protein BAJATHORv1_10537 [Candidatus Thorarchaeota archaeon]